MKSFFSKSVFCALFLALTAFAAGAQTPVEEGADTLHGSLYSSKVPVWLHLTPGTAFLQSIDKGASPMRYVGVGANLDYGVTVEWGRYHTQADMRGLAGVLTNAAATPTYDIGLELRAEMLYRVSEYPEYNFYLWVGGALREVMDIRLFSQLMNASTGVSNFAGLQAVGMMQFDFARCYHGVHHFLTLYGKLSLPLLNYVSRPGYTYMDNYTSDLNTENTILQDYENFTMLFSGATTDVGLRLNLPNQNKIAVSYRWDYLTTGDKGTYRFDHAAHSFLTTFMFNLH